MNIKLLFCILILVLLFTFVPFLSIVIAIDLSLFHFDLYVLFPKALVHFTDKHVLCIYTYEKLRITEYEHINIYKTLSVLFVALYIVYYATYLVSYALFSLMTAGGGTAENVDMMSKYMPLKEFTKIYVVDLCGALCKIASEKVKDKGWNNVEVVEGDACLFKPKEV